MQRFIVADDHPLFREGLVRILRQLQPDAQVEQADSLQQVLDLARQGEPPTGLLLDLLYPGQDLSFSLRALRQEFKRSTLIVVSMLEDATVIEHILAAGVDGFIGKALPPAAMAAAIADCLAGQPVVRYATATLGPPALDPDNTLGPVVDVVGRLWSESPGPAGATDPGYQQHDAADGQGSCTCSV